ncbi:MAG: hypothetical protein ACRESR_06150 [Gammaproteobacteria bacterium]
MKARQFLIGSLLLFAGCSLSPQPPRIVGQMRAPIDFHAVRLYLPQCAPAQYETVAKLDASKLGNFSSYQFNLRWIKQLRKQAAGLGANGLLLVQVNSPLEIGAIRHGPAFTANAIWEPPETAPHSGTSMWALPCLQTRKSLRYHVTHGWGPGMYDGGS